MGDALQNLRVHFGQLAATSLCRNLNLAGRLKHIHGQKCISNRAAASQQTMVAQHEEIGVAHICDQARLLVFAKGHALIGVISQRTEHKSALLADGQQALLLRRHRHACARVGVDHALHIGPRLMHSAVDDKTCRVHGKR